jgi:hypothetical protein
MPCGLAFLLLLADDQKGCFPSSGVVAMAGIERLKLVAQARALLVVQTDYESANHAIAGHTCAKNSRALFKTDAVCE